MRGRINKGMDVAEEAIWDGATECLFRTTKAKSKHEIEPEIERNVIGEIISRFRDKYRKGALRGMIAGAMALIGMIVTIEYPDNPQVGLTIILVAVYINGKGKREDVFGDASVIKRVFGETKIKTYNFTELRMHPVPYPPHTEGSLE